MAQAVKPPQTTMYDLNDDVLRETFSHLNFKELDAVADVCYTFRRVAREEFASRHKEVFLRASSYYDLIDDISTVNIGYPHWFSFLRKFGNATTSLHTVVTRLNTPLKAIIRNCSESLMELGLTAYIAGSYNVILEWQQLLPLLPRLRKLYLRGFLFNSSADASQMLSRCVELHSLSYSHARDGREVFLDSPVALPKLKSLDLHSCTPKSIECLLALNPQLEEIKLPHTSNSPWIEMVGQYVPNIAILTIRHRGRIDDWKTFKNLKTLHFEMVYFPPIHTMEAVANAAIPLEHLGLKSYNENRTNHHWDEMLLSDYKKLIEHCLKLKDLRELDLTLPAYPLDFRCIEFIVRHWPGLRKLRLKQLGLTLERIAEIIECGPNLQSLTYGKLHDNHVLNDELFMSIRNAVVNHSEHRPFHLRLEYDTRSEPNVPQELLEANYHILRIECLPEKYIPL